MRGDRRFKQRPGAFAAGNPSGKSRQRSLSHRHPSQVAVLGARASRLHLGFDPVRDDLRFTERRISRIAGRRQLHGARVAVTAPNGGPVAGALKTIAP
jgi:hypothetical protein